jgi:hypothetical protein
MKRKRKLIVWKFCLTSNIQFEKNRQKF